MVTFLKTLGIKDEFLAARVFCIWPEILARDVEASLRPVVTFHMSLGLEVTEISRIVCAWPQVLLVKLEQQKAFVDNFRQLGCSTEQVGGSAVWMSCMPSRRWEPRQWLRFRLNCSLYLLAHLQQRKAVVHDCRQLGCSTEQVGGSAP